MRNRAFIIIVCLAFVFLAYSFSYAQYWAALPPYNLLWPLWSPILSPPDPITGLPSPLTTELTSSTILPVQPGLAWDLLANITFAQTYNISETLFMDFLTAADIWGMPVI
ncbi:MAG: hypothetical protein ACMUHX_03010 [bacterium]